MGFCHVAIIKEEKKNSTAFSYIYLEIESEIIYTII